MKKGTAYTFYSFKGGVGRSMALANVAALFAKWGLKVLAVDWDLEAPGLEKFFPSISKQRQTTPGIIDLIRASAEGVPFDWRTCVLNTQVGSNGARLSLITAGRDDAGYSERLHEIDFARLFAEKNLGQYIEELRTEWLHEFDFVLIDSRTGVTDIGGICTVQLADILVLLVTTTEASVEGTKRIVASAREQQQKLPVDRQHLLAVPVPARDESRTEYERAKHWKERFAVEFEDLFIDWLPSGVTAQDAIERLRIPYVPYWSFGEKLPVIEEGASDPASIGAAYELLAKLLRARLDWSAAIGDAPFHRPAARVRQTLDNGWIRYLQSTTVFAGKVELIHGCLTATAEFPLSRLRPLVVVAFPHLDSMFNPPITRPIAENDAVRLEQRVDVHYSMSLTRRNGDCFAVETLNEDLAGDGDKLLDVELSIARAASGVLRAARLYHELGYSGDAEIELQLHWTGLIRRRLYSKSQDLSLDGAVCLGANLTSERVTFLLAEIPSTLKRQVKALCVPLFELFNFTEIPDAIYDTVISDVLSRD